MPSRPRVSRVRIDLALAEPSSADARAASRTCPMRRKTSWAIAAAARASSRRPIARSASATSTRTAAASTAISKLAESARSGLEQRQRLGRAVPGQRGAAGEPARCRSRQAHATPLPAREETPRSPRVRPALLGEQQLGHGGEEERTRALLLLELEHRLQAGARRFEPPRRISVRATSGDRLGESIPRSRSIA